MNKLEAQEYLSDANIHCSVDVCYTDGDHFTIYAVPTDMILPEFPASLVIPGYEMTEWFITRDGKIAWTFVKKPLEPADLHTEKFTCTKLLSDTEAHFKPNYDRVLLNFPDLPQGYEWADEQVQYNAETGVFIKRYKKC